MIDLSEFQSECEEKQRRTICKDRGPCQFIANNKSGKKVSKYTIDGNVIKNGKKCDFLFMNIDDKDAFFIEVKGSDIIHAIEQIEQTERLLAKSVDEYDKYYRIVYKTGTHDVTSSKVVNWKIKCGKGKDGRKKAIVKQLKLEEEI